MKLEKFVVLLMFVLVFSSDLHEAMAEDLVKDAYQLIGFEKIKSIPALFPKDICIFKIENKTFAGCLHYKTDGHLQFTLFKDKNGSYELIFERLTPLAINMDCISMGEKAYITLIYNLTETLNKISYGSPVFEVTENEINPVQYFATLHQNSVYLKSHKSELYLLHTYQNVQSPEFQDCPIYKWSGSHFNLIDKIPCQNAKHVEPFILDTNPFVIVANYADSDGDQHTTSVLYKYNYDQNKFVEHQKFQTTGAIDVKYFHVESEHRKKHFLVVANTVNDDAKNSSKVIGAPSIIYEYENSIFVPVQQFNFHTVLQFLPVYSGRGKFVMLVACKNQATKFLHYDGTMFFVSSVQLTEGALGKGVSTMRTFEDTNDTYIVIANERMAMNETNIYLPLYKRKENYKDMKPKMLEHFQALYKALSSEAISNLYREVENTLKSGKKGIRYFENAQVHEAVVQSFIDPARKMTKSYWKTISVIKAVVTNLDKKLDNLRNQTKSTSNTTSEDIHTVDTLSVKSLTITDQLDAVNINNKSQDHITLNSIIADSVIIKGKFIQKNTTMNASSAILGEKMHFPSKQFYPRINAKQIIATGTINGINLTDLERRILKNVGNQIITAPLKIGKLKVNDLELNGLISGQNLSKLVAIDNGNFVVNQDVQFVKPININRLVINERINHIHVVRGRLDALLKNSNETQVINGRKIFESVKLLEPIVLQGKIQSPSLEKISPIALVKQDIIIQGDYEISGDVTIEDFLSAENFYGESNTRNVLDALENGLSINASVIDQNMNFTQPISAYKAKTGFINNLDTRDFVTANSDEEQIITGHKTFRGDLNIHKGSCEVRNINNINIAALNKTRLQKYGQQNITGILNVRNVYVSRLNSGNPISLNGKNLNEILTTTTEQSIANHITIDELISENTNIENITGWKMIFNQDINYLIKDTVRSNESATIFGHKTFTGNVKVDKLVVRNKINNVPVQEIEKTLGRIVNDIYIEDDVQFDDDIKVNSLLFDGNINGIPKEKFGYNWLLSETDQEFTAPQTFETVTAESSYLSGRINDYQFNDLVNNVYWLDREENLQNVTFSKLIAQDDFITNGNINGFNFAENILLRESQQPQVLQNHVTCNKDVYITGKIKNLKFLNNIDLVNLDNILDGKIRPKLTVDSAVFENYPNFITLNGHNLDQLSKEIWFKDQDAVIEGELFFHNAEFLSSTVLNGPINGVDLKFLHDNYFSLTKPQRIETPIVFEGFVTVESSLGSEVMETSGILVDSVSNAKLNITDFAINSLRKDIVQEITGEWSFLKILVPGNLDHVLINGYRLIDDVMRYDIPINNITAPKYFESATITNLYCGPHATVNNIDMLEWMRNAVYTYGNHTIQGNVSMDDIQLYDDVRVLGTVNGIKFDESNLLLKNIDQVIHGNVEIRTILKGEKQIMPLTFEKISTKTINGIDVEQFFKSLVPNRDELMVRGNIFFQTSPTVQHLYSDHDIFHLNDSSNGYGARHFVQQLETIYQNVTDSLKEDQWYLSHFEVKQTVLGKIRKVVKLRIASSTEPDHLIAILRGDKELYITFHKWDKKTGLFLLDDEIFSWLGKDSKIIDYHKTTIQGAEILIIETFSHGIYTENFITSTSHGLQMIFQSSSNQSQQISSIEYNGKQCFLQTTVYQQNLILSCINITSDGRIHAVKELIIYTNGIVVQTKSLKKAEFAVISSTGIEIWDLSLNLEPIGRITVPNPKSLSFATFDNHEYLAISTSIDRIEIYRASQGSEYQHFQSIDFRSSTEIKFAVISPSNDFILYALSASATEPFTAYEFRGVVGFQKFMRPPNLTIAKGFDVVSLDDQKKHFFCYITEEKAIFVEAVLKFI